MVTDPLRNNDDAPAYPATVEPSGDPSVDRLTADLNRIPGQPISEQQAVYAGLHDGLLAELNANPESNADPGSDDPHAVRSSADSQGSS